MENFDPNKPSEGFGDTVAKITHALGLNKVAEKLAEAMGEEDCGCNKRRVILNEMLPYNKTEKPAEQIYEVVQDIRKDINGEIILFKVGQRVLIGTNHPLYPGLEVYLSQNYLKLDATEGIKNEPPLQDQSS